MPELLKDYVIVWSDDCTISSARTRGKKGEVERHGTDWRILHRGLVQVQFEPATVVVAFAVVVVVLVMVVFVVVTVVFVVVVTVVTGPAD